MSKEMSLEGINMLKRTEGVRLKPYKDSVGKWTVGVGHLITNASDINKTFTMEEVEDMLEDDLIRFEDMINDVVLVDINQYKFDALVHFSFNIGEKAFNNSTLLKLLNENKYSEAADQFLVWIKQKELLPRRERERDLFLNGVYS